MMVKYHLNNKESSMPPRYTQEFKHEAVKQVTVNNYEIKDTAYRLGIHPSSLKSWIKKYDDTDSLSDASISRTASLEIKQLKKELKRVEEERDILKKAAAYFASHLN